MSDVISELIMRVSELEKRLANICRIAKVTAVHEDIGKLDVNFEGLPLKKIPFQTMRAGEDQTYWLPSVGELGFLFSPSGDIANAIFVPGIYFKDFPAGDSTTQKSKRIFRDGMEEEIDVDAHSQKFTSGDSERFINREKIEDKKGTSAIKINDSETEIKRSTGKIKEVVGTNMNELTMILMNLIGAHFFPTGITTLQCPVGPVMFAPATSPASAPSAPDGSEPNSEGKVTKTPKSEISGVKIKATSNIDQSLTAQTMTLIVTTPIPVVTPAGPGSIAAGSYPIQLTGTPKSTVTGKVNLEFPARDL